MHDADIGANVVTVTDCSHCLKQPDYWKKTPDLFRALEQGSVVGNVEEGAKGIAEPGKHSATRLIDQL